MRIRAWPFFRLRVGPLLDREVVVLLVTGHPFPQIFFRTLVAQVVTPTIKQRGQRPTANWLNSMAAGRMNSSLLRIEPIAILTIGEASRSEGDPVDVLRSHRQVVDDDTGRLGAGRRGHAREHRTRHGEEQPAARRTGSLGPETWRRAAGWAAQRPPTHHSCRA